MIRLALDTMGADAGIEPLVGGAAALSLEDAPIQIVLVGAADGIASALKKHRHAPDAISVVDAPDFVAMTEKPKVALEQRPGCSVMRAAQLVADGHADALVSSGNTGAVILAASKAFKRLHSVRRVGLAAVYPTFESHGPHNDPFALMLDVGATLRCEAADLAAFAVMGGAYSRVISDIAKPRVALLSNGSESTKGLPSIVEAHALLDGHPAFEFCGNIEGMDITRGTVDVVICEGFVGNIVLKMLEGVSTTARDLVQVAYGSKLRYKLALAMMSKGIEKIKTLTDWKHYGGAPIVGFDHPVIKAHGRSNARAIRNALKVAAKTVERGLCQKIETGLHAVTSRA